MIRFAVWLVSLSGLWVGCASPAVQPVLPISPASTLSHGPSDSGSQGRQTEPVQPQKVPPKVKPEKKKLKIIPHVIHETREPVQKTSKLPAVLQEIESKYSAAKTLEAQFRQVTFQKALGKSKQSTGILKVKRPNKVRWETQQPDPNLLVSDGKTFWFYTPPFEAGDSGQLMTKKTSEVQSRLANALLSGSFSMAEDMKIETKDGSRFMLFPKPGSAGTVLKAEIVIDPVAKVIQDVNLFHQGGNEAKIQLSNIRLGTAEPDSTFQFVAPAGTEIIKN